MPINTEMVTITKKEYDSLLDARAWRCALESGGVDNWEGYDDSLHIAGYYTEDEESEEDIYGS